MATDDESHIELLSRLSVPRYATRLNPTPIPTAHWDDDPLYCLKVNDQWISHILGVMIALDQPDTWIGTPDEIYAARQQVNEIMVAFMEQCDPMSNCCPEPLTRITSDGKMQVSYDGGATWQDATTEDPRNTAPQMPPLPGDDGTDKRCTAANNVLGQFKDGISTFEGYFDTLGTLLEFATAVAGFIAAVIFAPTAVPIVVGAIIALLSGVWSAGKEAYTSAFDDEIYGKLLCIIYCHCEPDGTFTDADFSAILSDISSQFTTEIDGFFIARDAFLALLNGVTTAGLNNLAKIPTGSSASCDSCDCGDGCFPSWEYFDETSGTTVTKTSGEWVINPSIRGDGQYYVIIQGATDDDCCILGSFSNTGSVEFTYYNPCGETRADIVMGLHPGSVLGHDANAYLFKSSVTFEVTITSA